MKTTLREINAASNRYVCWLQNLPAFLLILCRIRDYNFHFKTFSLISRIHHSARTNLTKTLYIYKSLNNIWLKIRTKILFTTRCQTFLASNNPLSRAVPSKAARSRIALCNWFTLNLSFENWYLWRVKMYKWSMKSLFNFYLLICVLNRVPKFSLFKIFNALLSSNYLQVNQ